jgi:dTDP-glucose 4,6-dehydratase
MTIFVTGAAGFIGSNFVREWFKFSDEAVISIDKLTYAGNIENLKSLNKKFNHRFIKSDIASSNFISQLLKEYQPRAIINFAAESHVDLSISKPEDFIYTNIVATYKLLEEVRFHWDNLFGKNKKDFRFLHISTDEVYGSLLDNQLPSDESKAYQPNSPYSATKAASDHLVRAWNSTYGIPVLTTNCANNYGPYQHPEKLIPLCISNALDGRNLPIYGDGMQIRDWLYVLDHCSGIRAVLERGRVGQTYNIGAFTELSNISVINTLCDLLDKITPKKNNESYNNQIIFIKDRPGHDQRYAIDASKIMSELTWKPNETFSSGIKKTVEWYMGNQEWVRNSRLSID